MERRNVRSRALWSVALCAIPALLMAAAQPADEAIKEILAAYQRSLDALRRGDADAAMAIDTNDWVSITLGQKPRTRQEMEPFIRRDIAGMKPPPDWSATWKPDYQQNGTASGLQIYKVDLEGDTAVVFCLVVPRERGNRRHSAERLARLTRSRYLDQNRCRLETPDSRETDGE